MKEHAKSILIVLLFIAAFLGGRAEGWYEAHLFMEKIAEALSRIPPPC